MEKGVLRRLFGFLRGPPHQRKAESEGNERTNPCAVIGIPYSSDAAEETVEKEEEDVMKSIAKYMFVFAAVAVAAFALSACGGGGGGGGTTGATSAPAVSTGTLTKGSVIVNGVRFTAATGATIKIDDNPGRPEAELRDGMEVKVKGSINDDRITGQFEKVEAEPRVRGQMTGRGADDFTVHNHHVITDDNTVFEDRSAGGAFTNISFNDFADLNEVEVHGGLDDLGNVRATRIERRNDNPNDEVRGVVTAKVGTVISIGAFSIDIAGVTTSPAGQTVNVGDLVEVHLNAAGTVATLVDIEDLEDAEFEPAQGQEFEVEGYIGGFTAHPGTFQVGNQTVTTTSATTFRNGAAVDLANGLKVEAEGHFDNVTKVLTATRIEFKRSRIVLEGLPSGQTATQVTVAGKTAVINSLTRNTFTTGRMRVKGFEDKNGAIIAERLEDAGGGGGRDVIQARVTATNGSSSLTLLGTAFTAATGAVYMDVNDSVITASAFFAAVVPKSSTNPGTLVKIKFTPASTSYEEAELEN